jgi:hypothetical protein
MPQGKMDTLSYVLRDPNDAADELDRLRAALESILLDCEEGPTGDLMADNAMIAMLMNTARRALG